MKKNSYNHDAGDMFRALGIPKSLAKKLAKALPGLLFAYDKKSETVEEMQKLIENSSEFLKETEEGQRHLLFVCGYATFMITETLKKKLDLDGGGMPDILGKILSGDTGGDDGFPAFLKKMLTSDSAPADIRDQVSNIKDLIDKIKASGGKVEDFARGKKISLGSGDIPPGLMSSLLETITGEKRSDGPIDTDMDDMGDMSSGSASQDDIEDKIPFDPLSMAAKSMKLMHDMSEDQIKQMPEELITHFVENVSDCEDCDEASGCTIMQRYNEIKDL